MATGAYFRVMRDGKPETVELEYLTDSERREVIRDRDKLFRCLDIACEAIVELTEARAKVPEASRKEIPAEF